MPHNISQETALRYLQTDPLLHMSMIDPLKRGSAELLYAGAEGVLLRELKSDAYMLAASSFNTGAELIALIPDTAGLFLAHQGFWVESLRDKFNLGTVRECVQAVYLRQEPLPLSGCLSVRQLGPEYLPLVLEHYHTMDDDTSYVEELIKSGVIYGGFAQDTLIGFIGRHFEGSMGLLEVFPEQRRRGYAAELESFVVNLLLAQGETPFGHIFVDNEKSLALQKRLGFEFAGQHIYWLY